MVKVSVLIPAYNEEKFLKEAVKSVINQSMQDFEIIIINNASKDKTKEIAESFTKKYENIKLINLKKNKFRSGGLNEGLKYAKGKYIAFLDADDLYDQDKLKIQAKFMEKNPNADLIYGKLKLFGEVERENVPLKQEGKNLKELLKKRAKENLDNLVVGKFLGLGGAIGSASVMIKHQIFKKCEFDEKLKRTQDYDLWFQMIGKGHKFVYVKGKPLYYYRIHSGQNIRNKKEMNKARDYILKKLKRGDYFK